jgi:hypothetical protein
MSRAKEPIFGRRQRVDGARRETAGLAPRLNAAALVFRLEAAIMIAKVKSLGIFRLLGDVG